MNPKYKNGREAKIGDAVIGTGDNLKGLIVGHLVAFTNGGDNPPSKDGIRVLTYLKSGHKDASTATFQTVQEFGGAGNFLHADDAFASVGEKTPENKGENSV